MALVCFDVSHRSHPRTGSVQTSPSSTPVVGRRGRQLPQLPPKGTLERSKYMVFSLMTLQHCSWRLILFIVFLLALQLKSLEFLYKELGFENSRVTSYCIFFFYVLISTILLTEMNHQQYNNHQELRRTIRMILFIVIDFNRHRKWSSVCCLVIKFWLFGVPGTQLIICEVTWIVLQIANIKPLHFETGRERKEKIMFKIGKVSKIFHNSYFIGTVTVLIFNVLEKHWSMATFSKILRNTFLVTNTFSPSTSDNYLCCAKSV